jgi:Tfp pilus assembly protein PilX
MDFNMNKKEKGFAMIFTVLIMSLILSITMGMSNIVFKQRILSGLVRDSQIAFYQADAGSECGLLQEYKLMKMKKGVAITSTSPNYQFDCGEKTMLYSKTESDKTSTANDYFVYQQVSPNPNSPCFTIVFDKRDASKIVIDSRGYKYCIL